MVAPLSGVRVLEVANMIAAPGAAAMMADLGADVIKVEPLSGDILRGLVLGPDFEPDPWFELDNRGKRDLAVDLNQPSGVDVVHRLATRADIMITNLTAARQRRFSLTAPDLHARNPALIHTSLSGYGAEGPDADRLAYDMTAFFARGGVQSLVREPGRAPAAFRPGQGDHTSSLSILSAVLAALRLRDQTGEGQTIEVALMQVAAYTVSDDLSASLVTGTNPELHERASFPSPMTCRFRCSDDRWIAFCMPGPKDFFPSFAECLGRPEWVTDTRFNTVEGRRANATELIAECDEIFATVERAVWQHRLDEADLTWAPVQTMEDLANDPQAEAIGLLHLIDDHPAGPFHTVNAPFRIVGADVAVRGRAPRLGEHSSEVLDQAGFSVEEIEQLLDDGIVVDGSHGEASAP